MFICTAPTSMVSITAAAQHQCSTNQEIKKQQLQPLPLLPEFQVWLERVHLKFLFPKGTFYNYILDIRTRKMKDTKRR